MSPPSCAPLRQPSSPPHPPARYWQCLSYLRGVTLIEHDGAESDGQRELLQNHAAHFDVEAVEDGAGDDEHAVIVRGAGGEVGGTVNDAERARPARGSGSGGGVETSAAAADFDHYRRADRERIALARADARGGAGVTKRRQLYAVRLLARRKLALRRRLSQLYMSSALARASGWRRGGFDAAWAPP